SVEERMRLGGGEGVGHVEFASEKARIIKSFAFGLIIKSTEWASPTLLMVSLGFEMAVICRLEAPHLMEVMVSSKVAKQKGKASSASVNPSEEIIFGGFKK